MKLTIHSLISTIKSKVSKKISDLIRKDEDAHLNFSSLYNENENDELEKVSFYINKLLCKNARIYERIRAASWLGSFNHESIHGALIRVIEDETNGILRREAATSLAKIAVRLKREDLILPVISIEPVGIARGIVFELSGRDPSPELLRLLLLLRSHPDVQNYDERLEWPLDGDIPADYVPELVRQIDKLLFRKFGEEN